MDLAPLDMLPQAHLAWIYKDAHMADKTIEQSKHMLEIDPNFHNGYYFLGEGYALKGQWSEAAASFEHTREKNPRGYPLAMARLWALAGKRTQAEAAWADFLKNSENAKFHVPPFLYAEFYGALGDRDKAFEWLEKAYKKQAAELITLKVDMYLDKLRSDPRFQDLERRVGFK
jgi:tetratricopeptide (TPR) repeat protein